jgi:flagellar hook-length control protein FliK
MRAPVTAPTAAGASSGQGARAAGAADRVAGLGSAEGAMLAPFSSALAAAHSQDLSAGGAGSGADDADEASGSGASGVSNASAQEARAAARQPAAVVDTAEARRAASRAPASSQSDAPRTRSAAEPTATADAGAAAIDPALDASATGFDERLAPAGATGRGPPDAAAGARGGERAGKRGPSASDTSSSSVPTLALLLGADPTAVASALAALGAGNSAAPAAPDGDTSGSAAAAAAASSRAVTGADSAQQTLRSQDAGLTLSATELARAGSSLSALASAAADSLAVARWDNLRSGGEAASDTTAGSAGAAAAADGSANGGSANNVANGTAAPALVDLIPGLTPAVGTVAVTPAAAALALPVSDPHWPDALAAQVQWLATRQIQSATLRLTPEHLGPLEVRIEVARSQVNVNFSAHHPETREALAQAVPRLRELFSASGLSLGQATVQQESPSGQQAAPVVGHGLERNDETVEPVANTAVGRLGLIDEYV